MKGFIFTTISSGMLFGGLMGLLGMHISDQTVLEECKEYNRVYINKTRIECRVGE